MTAYDPALCEQLCRETRDTSGDSALTSSDPSRGRLAAMADQLEAAKREIDRLTGHLGSCAEHSRLLAKSQMVDRAAIADLTAERDALRAEIEHLTAAAQLSRSGAAEAVRDHDRLTNENEQLKSDLERMRPVIAAADTWRDATDVTKGRPTGAEILRAAIALSDTIDAYRAAKERP